MKAHNVNLETFVRHGMRDLSKKIEELRIFIGDIIKRLDRMNKDDNRKHDEELILFYNVISFIKTIDTRDSYILSHSLNVAFYSYMIAELIGMNDEEKFNIYLGALIHDIGKVGIPEEILTKAGTLSTKEWEIIKLHTTFGHWLIHEIEQLQERGITDIVLYHHERYDGKGYPEGIKGENIPLAARIVSIADSFDAMTTNRAYRRALDIIFAANEIYDNSNTQFDPFLAKVFSEYILKYKI